MIRAIPSAAMYALFACGAVLAPFFPVWKLWLFGFNPTLDELLQLRCFG
jgi:hypothetical protein